jgi:hypothetical protein
MSEAKMYDEHDRTVRELEKYIRSHPIRVRILALYEEDNGRSLAPADLHREIDELLNPTVVSIAYHLQVLRRTGMLPAPTN